MDEVTVRELRNHGGEVIDRVAGGETLTVTRAGKRVAELRPLTRPPLKATALLSDGGMCRLSTRGNSGLTSTRSSTRHYDRHRMTTATATPTTVPPAPPLRGLLDTNAVILLPRLIDPAVLPEEPLISAITLAELSVGPMVASTDAERAARQTQVQQAEADFDPLPFDASAARAFGRVTASLRRAGRKPTARTYDAMIAAVALAHDLPLYTCNSEDFAGIDDLHVVAVPHPDQVPKQRT